MTAERAPLSCGRSLKAFPCVLGEECIGCDASGAHAGATRWDYLALMSASISQSE
jgi:hypothetical protein